MGANLIGELVANNGTYFFQGGRFEGNVDQIIVRGQGIISVEIWITVDEEYVNVTNQYLFHGNETPLPDGLRITPKNNDVFTKVSINMNEAEAEGTGLELVLAA
jgi:hypothetical protein